MFDRELRLNGDLGKSYLIQRIEKPWKRNGEVVTNPFSFGGGLRNGGLSEEAFVILRDIMAFDYMGSAEFEFGAVPRTFQFLAKQSSANNLATGFVRCGDKDVYYISPKPYESGVRERITKLYQDEHQFRLKEGCWLRSSLDGDKYREKIVGWLELDNGFAFFTDREMYESVSRLFSPPKKK